MMSRAGLVCWRATRTGWAATTAEVTPAPPGSRACSAAVGNARTAPLRSRSWGHGPHAPLGLRRKKVDHVAPRRSARGDRAEPGEVERVECRDLPCKEALEDQLRSVELSPQLLRPG